MPGGATSDVSVIAVFSAILYLLVLTRLWDAAASHRRALDRERVLRQAGLSLVTAADVPAGRGRRQGRASAPCSAARRRATRCSRYGLTARSAPCPADGADPPPAERLGELAEGWLPLVTGTAPTLTGRSASCPSRPGRPRPGAEWMLLCPLTLKDRPSGDPLIGLIAVFGEQRILADLSATLEILAHQVALAVEGIMLRQEVIRQRNEAYFRTLVQDASDAILIVGDDGTVKYATPSATTIFGDITGGGRAASGTWSRTEERGELRAHLHASCGSARDSAPRFVDQRDHPPRRQDASTSRPGAATCATTRPSPAWSSPCGT